MVGSGASVRRSRRSGPRWPGRSIPNTRSCKESTDRSSRPGAGYRVRAAAPEEGPRARRRRRRGRCGAAMTEQSPAAKSDCSSISVVISRGRCEEVFVEGERTPREDVLAREHVKGRVQQINSACRSRAHLQLSPIALAASLAGGAEAAPTLLPCRRAPQIHSSADVRTFRSADVRVYPARGSDVTSACSPVVSWPAADRSA
jgi:hypothetical protein